MRWLVQIAIAFVSAAAFALPDRGPDPASSGPFTTQSAEYKLPARIDPTVLTGAATELWARVYWPKDLSTPRPLLVFLHGNHSTCGVGRSPHEDNSCEYTEKGTCPSGYEIVKNHEGYGYVAEHLATHGYVVVSINANRGITCGEGFESDAGLILARGRMVLRHIQEWNRWVSKGEAPESLGLGATGWLNAIDFSNVGLFGHSRGGEGVRAALTLYRDKKSPWIKRIPNLNIRGIFEVGAVDGQSARVLDADGVAWNQLLPMCDGDVDDLQGRLPYERMLAKTSELDPTPKSLYLVWGANHNFFNSEWQNNDSRGCLGHQPIYGESYESIEQQKVASAGVTSFFLANVGARRAEFARHMDPSFRLPEWLEKITRIDRDFIPTFDQRFDVRFEEFDRPTGANTSGAKNKASNLTISHTTESNTHLAELEWKRAGTDVYFQTNWTEPGSGRDASTFDDLNFRVARQDVHLDSTVKTDFRVYLVGADEKLYGGLRVSDYAEILGPVNYTRVYQTVRLPLAAFGFPADAQLRGVRFVFDLDREGSIYLANVRLTSPLAQTGAVKVLPRVHTPLFGWQAKSVPIQIEQAELVSTKLVKRSPFLRDSQAALEVTVRAPKGFPIGDALPVLVISGERFNISRLATSKNDQLTFTVPHSELKSLPSKGSMNVEIGRFRLWELPSYSFQGD